MACQIIQLVLSAERFTYKYGYTRQEEAFRAEVIKSFLDYPADF